MPLYDYTCDNCGSEDIDVLQSFDDCEKPRACTNCEALMRRKYSAPVPHTFPIEGIFLEHVSPDGKRFFSRNEMKAYEKKHDMVIDMLH